MDKNSLRKFLVEASNAGYAGGEEKKWTKEKDESTTIVYESGRWRMHDNYFGGEPYGGREVIFLEGKPVWIMIYYGRVETEINDLKLVYSFLQKALKEMREEHPFRGPKNFSEGEFVYQNSWEGDIDRFSGEETISQNDKQIYKGFYRGGMVDQREE